MEKGKISALQLFCLIVLFELGSAVVVGVGLKAKQDAWIAILLGMSGGMALFLLYGYLSRCYPGLPLTGYIPKIVGALAGIPLSYAYTAYFFYISARVLRDFGELLATSTLTDTPLYAINGLMIILIVYGACLGIEVIGRTGEPVLFAMLLSMLTGIVAIGFSPKFEIISLLPVLENGWKPVLSTVFPQTLTFPFGEMIVFTMLLPTVNLLHSGIKFGLYAIAASGLILTVTIVADIAVMGADTTLQSQFPLLETFSKANIGGFIQSLDILVISTLILGMFMKITIFFYAGMAGFAQLLRLKKEAGRRYWSMVFGLGVLLLSIYMSGSFTEHIYMGLYWVPPNLHLPFQVGIPLLLFLITWYRRRRKPSNGGNKKESSPTHG